MSAPRAEQLAALVHVTDVQRSAAFYARLGFETVSAHEQEGWLLWCAIESGSARLMLTLASEPAHRHDEQEILLYLLVHDLDGLHADLRAAGVIVGEIADGSPGPPHEFRVEDPDGHVLMVAER